MSETIQILIEGRWIRAEFLFAEHNLEEFCISGFLLNEKEFPEGTNKLLVNQEDRGGEYFISSFMCDCEKSQFTVYFSSAFERPKSRLKLYLINQI